MLTIKNLSLKSLISGFKESFIYNNDERRQNSVNYTVMDTALSVLACMFYKSSSLLKYQRMLKLKFYQNNLETQFGVQNIGSSPLSVG